MKINVALISLLGMLVFGAFNQVWAGTATFYSVSTLDGYATTTAAVLRLSRHITICDE